MIERWRDEEMERGGERGRDQGGERGRDRGGEREGNREVEVNHQSNWSLIIPLASRGEGLVQVVGKS